MSETDNDRDPREWPPRPPMAQRPATAHYPRVVDQRPLASGHVRVTFSLPGLRSMTVRVPQEAWVEGSHLHIGVAAIGWLDQITGPLGPLTPDPPDEP